MNDNVPLALVDHMELLGRPLAIVQLAVITSPDKSRSMKVPLLKITLSSPLAVRVSVSTLIVLKALFMVPVPPPEITVPPPIEVKSGINTPPVVEVVSVPVKKDKKSSQKQI